MLGKGGKGRNSKLGKEKKERKEKHCKRKRGREEEWRQNKKNGSCKKRKNVLQWQQECLDCFHTWKKASHLSLLLSSSSFNSRNLKDEGTPGQFFLADKLKCRVQIKSRLALLLDSCFIVFLCVHQPISVLLVS